MKRKFWAKKKYIYFIGIGGISMSGLAYFMQKQGFCVAGSDVAAGVMTAKLEEEGIKVHYGHAPERVGIADAVIVNSAIAEDDPELA